MDPKWIFFHCVKKNRIEPYVCRQITNIYEVKVPNIEANEFLIPLCGYIPRIWHRYYLAKYIRRHIQVNIADDHTYVDELPLDLVV